MHKILASLLDSSVNPGNYEKIEQVRNQLRGNPEMIEMEQFGVGSFVNHKNEVAVRDIAEHALTKPWQCRMLYRLGLETGAKTIIELGTSLGISTSYLASLNNGTKVYTFEGTHLLTQYARVVFSSLSLSNVELIEGHFDETLPKILKDLSEVNLSFIDGNHSYASTKKYFDWIIQKSKDEAVIVLDDIYWSKDMNKAWEEIILHPRVTASLDLYKFGIVFLNPKASGHFKVFTKKVFDY